MALDPTARESNFKDSIKKYFIDTLVDVEGLNVSFDKVLSTPYLQTMTLQKWVMINWGPFIRGTLSDASIDIVCCVRKDNEGFLLAQLVDKVMGYLTDVNATHGMKSITFYRSFQSSPWVEIGGILVHNIMETGTLEAPDLTKYKILNVQFKFASRV